MPYVTKEVTKSTNVVRERLSSGIPYYSDSFNTSYFSSYLIRSGTNSTPAALRAAGLKPRQKSTSFVLKPISVPKGPRLAYKVYSAKYKRWIWARAPITVYRLVRVRRYIPRMIRGLDLPPNALNLYSSTVYNENVPRKILGISLTDPTESLSNSGPLESSFVPSRSKIVLQPNLSALSSGAPGPRFSNAAANLEPKVLNLLYERVKNQKTNLAQTLAERAQTAKMLSDTVVRLAKAVVLAKKGKLQAASKTLFPGNSKQLANDYLMFQYGVKPLLSDIQGAAEHLADPESFSFDIIAKRTEIISPEITDYQHRNYCYADTRLISFGKVSVTYKVRVVVSNNFERDISRLGFKNLESLVWELLPYSFVADWFLPIGDFLNNQDAFSGLTIAHGHKTVFQEEILSVRRKFGGTDSANYNWPSLTLDPWICKRVSCVRTPMTVLPPLGFPSLKDPVSAGHIANAMALLRQKYR